MRKDSNQIKDLRRKYKPETLKEEMHCGEWLSVKSWKKNRLIDSQILIEFFHYPNRLLNFGRYIASLNTAIEKLG